MKITRGIALAAAAAMSLTTLAACGSDTAQDEETPDSLSFWYYEEDDAGQTQAWRRAAEAFEKETGVKINFERKSFTQIAQNGSQFLNSDEAPDLMESNRGNGSAGVLSTMGLLTDLGDYVDQYGWDKKVTGANAAVAKYDENGIMDGDTWYGMTVTRNSSASTTTRICSPSTGWRFRPPMTSSWTSARNSWMPE